MPTNEALEFQSTSSTQRKTNRPGGSNRHGLISIHFLYTEEDLMIVRDAESESISIHFLYTEEDEGGKITVIEGNKFQSTSSTQRKTGTGEDAACKVHISIHFLYTEEDRKAERMPPEAEHFNPLPLHRGRPEARPWLLKRWDFNPLPLHRGRPQRQPTSLSFPF